MIKTIPLSVVLAALALTSTAGAVQASGQTYVSIEGTKQGNFKGEGHREFDKNKIPVLSFEYQVQSPRDAASGQPSGKRQHSPIKVTIPWGAASPQIFQAITTNEVLKNVVLEFYAASPNGEEQLSFRITLTNATIPSVNMRSGLETGARADAAKAEQLEDVSFTFQRIVMESIDGRTAASDDSSR